ncbi:hypothetical protein BXT86_04120 [candidate division WOR-3 bacterium 4484_100]|uniref:Uncharacterized protein n=1 Tax=candidate division WOR-3 bacterium 4484_100 TaxID=1936077 RepID=A0A1V4QEV6_UNCW3|nr:MAG: hypothetical protein BXT86_04120 [candidate division WOR-3 bacterium 4484_100]
MGKTLTTWKPFTDLADMVDDMGQLFRDFFDYPKWDDNFFRPALDIEEDNENITVKTEVPGLKKEDIKVSVRGNLLTISGEKKRENETNNKTIHRIERCYGKFQRSITLPADIEPDQVKASYKDGVLTVTLKKPEVLKPKEIEVEVK